MAARPGRVGQERGEALHPSEHGHVIDLDPALAEQLLDIAIRQAEPQIPTHREDNDLRREAEPSEPRARDRGYQTRMTTDHPLRSPPIGTLHHATEPLWCSKYHGDWQYDVRNGAFHHEAGEALVFRVAPTKVLAFAKGDFAQTRFRFDAATENGLR